MRKVVVAVLLFVLTGCTPLHYVTQAAAGQEQLNEGGIAIDEVVEHGYLDKRTRNLLAQVPRIKAFGERHGLKRTKSYERYKWIGRPAVVWVVSACHPLAFRPKAWSFPVVGSITYTGWFDRKDAREYAAKLAKGGWDIDVRPSQAYSTLGWFDDPILSTMLHEGDEALGELADVVLHETLHATFYVPNQSTLNESIASFYGDELAVAYLDETVGPDSKEKVAFLSNRAKGERRAQLMKKAYEELAALYASPEPKEAKLARKKEITETLRAEIPLSRPVSNATLIQYKTYGSGKREMAELFALCDRDFSRMLRALEPLRESAKSAKSHADPGVLITPLLAVPCPR